MVDNKELFQGLKQPIIIWKIGKLNRGYLNEERMKESRLKLQFK